jgi:hypothetical protein
MAWYGTMVLEPRDRRLGLPRVSVTTRYGSPMLCRLEDVRVPRIARDARGRKRPLSKKERRQLARMVWHFAQREGRHGCASRLGAMFGGVRGGRPDMVVVSNDGPPDW